MLNKTSGCESWAQLEEKTSDLEWRTASKVNEQLTFTLLGLMSKLLQHWKQAVTFTLHFQNTAPVRPDMTNEVGWLKPKRWAQGPLRHLNSIRTIAKIIRWCDFSCPHQLLCNWIGAYEVRRESLTESQTAFWAEQFILICSKNDLLLLCLATPASRPRPWLTFCHGCIWAHRGCHFWFFLLINVTMYTNNFCCHCLGQINVFICSIRCTHPPWANLWISPQLCFIIIFSVLIWQRLSQCTIDINKVDGSGVVRGTLTGHGRLCDEARILDGVFDPKFSWDEASCERLSMDNPSKLPSRHLIHWKFKKGTKVGCHLHR